MLNLRHNLHLVEGSQYDMLNLWHNLHLVEGSQYDMLNLWHNIHLVEGSQYDMLNLWHNLHFVEDSQYDMLNRVGYGFLFRSEFFFPDNTRDRVFGRNRRNMNLTRPIFTYMLAKIARSNDANQTDFHLHVG